jgi:cytochrome P450
MPMQATLHGLPDLTDPDFYLGDPYPAYHRLHREAPVYWHPHAHSKRGGFWLVSGHAPLSWASRHPDVYSSLAGLALDGPDTEMINMMLSGSISCTDPPVHRDLRRMLLDVFKPTAMEALEPVIRSHVRELLDRIPVGEPFDLVETVAAPLPTWVVGELLGTPPAERVRLEHLVDALVAYSDADAGFDDTGAAAMMAGFSFFAELADARRAALGPDLVSAFLSGLVQDRPLESGEVIQSTYVLLVAGTETVRNVISNGILALAQHPEQLQRLREDPTLMEPAVEEMLRWISPVNYFTRTATVDAELGGAQIQAGDKVMLHFAAANRDEAVFGTDSDKFRIDRDPNPHVAMGVGEHYCLGAHLGRLESRLFFEEFLSRFSFATNGSAPRVRTTHIRGLRSLPLVVQAA